MSQLDLSAAPFSQAQPDTGGSTPDSSAPPELSLEQYASLCAELQADPIQTERNHSIYRATNEAASHALQTSWQAKLGVDANEQARFDALVVQYVTALRSR